MVIFEWKFLWKYSSNDVIKSHSIKSTKSKSKLYKKRFVLCPGVFGKSLARGLQHKRLVI